MSGYLGLDTLTRAEIENAITTLADIAAQGIDTLSAHRHNEHGQYAAALADLRGTAPVAPCPDGCENCERYPPVFEYRPQYLDIPSGHDLHELEIGADRAILWACQCGASGSDGPGGWGAHRIAEAEKAASVVRD